MAFGNMSRTRPVIRYQTAPRGSGVESCVFRSFCRERAVMGRHRVWLAFAVVALFCAAWPVGVSVQTPTAPALDPANPFFDDTVLQEVRLAINPRDWQSLKDHYLDNTY